MTELTAREEQRLGRGVATWLTRCFSGNPTFVKGSPISFRGPRGPLKDVENSASPQAWQILSISRIQLRQFSNQMAIAEGYVDVEDFMKNYLQIPGYKGTSKTEPGAVVTRMRIVPMSLEDLPEPGRRETHRG